MGSKTSLSTDADISTVNDMRSRVNERTGACAMEEEKRDAVDIVVLGNVALEDETETVLEARRGRYCYNVRRALYHVGMGVTCRLVGCQ